MLTIFDVPFGFAQMRASRQVFHQLVLSKGRNVVLCLWFSSLAVLEWWGSPRGACFQPDSNKSLFTKAVSNVSVLFFSGHGWYISSALSTLKFRTKTS